MTTFTEIQKGLMVSWGVSEEQVIAKAKSGMEIWNNAEMVQGGVFPTQTLDDAIQVVFNGDGSQF